MESAGGLIPLAGAGLMTVTKPVNAPFTNFKLISSWRIEVAWGVDGEGTIGE